MLGRLDAARRRAQVHSVPPPVSTLLAGWTAEARLRDALAFFSRERKWIDDQHLALCRVPAPTFREEKRATHVAALLKSLGWDAKTDRAGNVVALPAPDRGQPLVALTAHLDTVLAPRAPEEIRLDTAGRFLGPGVSDNGAGLAALLAMARLWKESPPVEDTPALPLLVANVGEEGEGNLSGMRFLCGKSPLAPRIRSFLVLDGPATDHITAEALACRRFEILLSGPGGHSWSDHGAANPVHALGRVISTFVDDRFAETSSRRASFNFGTVEGGATVNSIPSEARAKVDLRSESSEQLDEMAAQLARAVEAAAAVENERATGGRLQARLKETGSRPGGRLAEDAAILEIMLAVDAHLGVRSFLDCASTDANIPLSLGLSALSIGAGGQGGGAHTPSEWYKPEGRDIGLRRILLALCLLLREAPSAQ